MGNRIYKKDVIAFIIGLVISSIVIIGLDNSDISTNTNAKNVMDAGIYTGDFSKGNLEDEQGKFEFYDGTVYEGQIKADVFEGEGKLTLPNIGTYEGMFVNGLRDGYGELSFVNGDVYLGQWENDKMSGFGTYIFANGDKYVGNFLNNAFNGNGTYTFKDSNKKYEGTWENNEYKGEY